MTGSKRDKDSCARHGEIQESVDMPCKVISYCSEEGYWAVPCSSMFLKGGFGEGNKMSLEVVMRVCENTQQPPGVWAVGGKNSPLKRHRGSSDFQRILLSNSKRNIYRRGLSVRGFGW